MLERMEDLARAMRTGLSHDTGRRNPRVSSTRRGTGADDSFVAQTQTFRCRQSPGQAAGNFMGEEVKDYTDHCLPYAAKNPDTKAAHRLLGYRELVVHEGSYRLHRTHVSDSKGK